MTIKRLLITSVSPVAKVSELKRGQQLLVRNSNDIITIWPRDKRQLICALSASLLCLAILCFLPSIASTMVPENASYSLARVIDHSPVAWSIFAIAFVSLQHAWFQSITMNESGLVIFNGFWNRHIAWTAIASWAKRKDPNDSDSTRSSIYILDTVGRTIIKLDMTVFAPFEALLIANIDAERKNHRVRK